MEILVAKSAAQIHYEGQRIVLCAGRTTVRAGHPLLEQYGDLFEPLKVDYDTAAAAGPVEPDAKTVREWAAANGISVPARGKLPAEVVRQYQATQVARG
jgi:hypothetical protein